MKNNKKSDKKRDKGNSGFGIRMIAEERARQIKEEGWTCKHDDLHSHGQLAMAAAVYAMPSIVRDNLHLVVRAWPWASCWFKPTPKNRIKELAKAGGLIAAELDREQRLERRMKRKPSKAPELHCSR